MGRDHHCECGDKLMTLEDEEKEELGRQRFWRRVLIIWVIGFSLLCIYSVRSSRDAAQDAKKVAQNVQVLSQQNQERISDIQKSRISSCRANYRSFHTVFDPFFPPPDKRTTKQEEDFDKFNRIITAKIMQCKKQVLPPKTPSKEK